MIQQLDPNLKQLVENTFEIVQLIRQGTKGPIYLAHNRYSKQKLVLKCINLQKAKQYGSQYETKYKSQLSIIMKMQHVNVLKCYYFIENMKWRVLILQYFQNLSLFDYIKSKGTIQEESAIKIVSEIIQGFSVLQNQNIIHNNLKSQKVFVNGDQIKIAGFQNFKIGKTVKLKQNINYPGNRFTNAPQFYNNTEYDFQADIWSLGVIYYEMLNGTLPFKDIITQTRVASLQKDIDSMKILKQSKKFLKDIFVINPSKRLKWAQLYKMFYSNDNLFRKTLFMKAQQKTLIFNDRIIPKLVQPIQQIYDKTTIILSEKQRPKIITQPNKKNQLIIEDSKPQKPEQLLKIQQFALLVNNTEVIENIFQVYKNFHSLLTNQPLSPFYKCRKQILILLMLIDSQLIRIVKLNSSYLHLGNTMEQIKQFCDNDETIILFNKFAKDIQLFSQKHKQYYKSFIPIDNKSQQRPSSAQSLNKNCSIGINNNVFQRFLQYKCTQQQHIQFTLKSYEDFVIKIPVKQRERLQNIDLFMKLRYKNILLFYKVKK